MHGQCRRGIVVTAAAMLGVAAAGVVAAPAQAAPPNCAQTSCSISYDFTAGPQTFTVPAGVTKIIVSVSGAQGGDFLMASGSIRSEGGLGGRTVATLATTPGDVYTVVVGGVGQSGDTDAGDDSSARSGGYGGGGDSGPAGLWASSGGGGGSFFFGPSGALLLAAGGGGGATTTFTGNPEGGAGGAAGAPGVGGALPGSGGGATASQGGSAGPGTGGSPGTAGQGPASSPTVPGQGGAGGQGGAVSGAGGGGGYFGGGGGGGSPSIGPGSGSAGGGGSGFAVSTATDVYGYPGVNQGAGQVMVTWFKAVAGLSLSADPAGSSQVGEAVTFTARLSGTLGIPTGTVTFSGSGLSGCTAVPVDAAGVATCRTSALPVGDVTITADYTGDGTYQVSTTTLDYTIAKRSSTTTLRVAPADPLVTKPVVLTATVSGDLAAPTGTVAFLVDHQAIAGCAAQAVGASGEATCTTDALPTGTTRVTVAYGGDDTYQPSSAQADVEVSQLPSRVTVTGGPAGAQTGTPVTFTATVTGGDQTGTVAFSLDGTPIAACTAVPLDSAGVARCATTAPAAGAHVVTVAYSGDAVFAPSTGTLNYTVTAAPTPTPTPTPPPPLAATGSPAGIGLAAVVGVALVLLAGLAVIGARRSSASGLRRWRGRRG